MDRTISVNGIVCPIVRYEDGLSVVTFAGNTGKLIKDAAQVLRCEKGSFGFVANALIRISKGKENIRIDSITFGEDKVAQLEATMQMSGDVGQAIVCFTDKDKDGKDDPFSLKFIDGNARAEVRQTALPLHEYTFCQIFHHLTPKEIRQIQWKTSIGVAKTPREIAFSCFDADLETKGMSELDRDADLAIYYAVCRKKGTDGKALFKKAVDRATRCCTKVWDAFSASLISEVVLDAFAVLYNIDTGMMTELQESVLAEGLAKDIKPTEYKALCMTRLANHEQAIATAKALASHDQAIATAKANEAAKPPATPIAEDGTIEISVTKATRGRGLAAVPDKAQGKAIAEAKVETPPNPKPPETQPKQQTVAQTVGAMQQSKLAKKSKKGMTNAPDAIAVDNAEPKALRTPPNVGSLLKRIQEMMKGQNLVDDVGCEISTSPEGMEAFNDLSQIELNKALQLIYWNQKALLRVQAYAEACLK